MRDVFCLAATWLAAGVAAHAAEITRSKRDASGEMWSVSLSTDGSVKLANTIPADGPSKSVSLAFPRSEALDVEALLKKFRQWSALAEKNAVSAAEKNLGTIGEKALTFRVESNDRRTLRTLGVEGEDGALSAEDARELLGLLGQLPALDAEMAESKLAAATLPEDSAEVARNEALGRRAELHASALQAIRKRFPAPRAQYSTLGAADDAFTSCRPLDDGTWEARGVVQAKFEGRPQRRAWTVRLRPGDEDSVEILAADEKPLASSARGAVTQTVPTRR